MYFRVFRVFIEPPPSVEGGSHVLDVLGGVKSAGGRTRPHMAIAKERGHKMEGNTNDKHTL